MPTGVASVEPHDVEDALPSRRLAAYLSRMTLADIPDEATRLLKLCLLDTLGCAFGALATEPARVIAQYAARPRHAGPCSVIGGTPASPEVAAMANGTLSHILIFDDLHRHAKLHPGVAVIPVALAAADLARLDGKTLLTAIAVGYEMTARVGVAVGMAAHRGKGWRATGTCGSFGAAMAAARVLGLGADASHHALAAAAAQASGAWAFQESGGMELYLAAGTAARNGVAAALLAESGFKGAADPFGASDGGFFMLTSDAGEPARLDEALGARFRLRDTCIKMHPTCHSTQTAIDAALNLRQRHGLELADVDRARVRAGDITRQQCGWAYEPAPPAKLIFHMGYALALALRNGRLLPEDFEGSSPRDPELTRLARATEVVADPELTAIYAERKPCDVTLILRDGRTLNERVDYCRGEPENPPSEDSVVEKFRALAETSLSERAMDELADVVLSLERQPDTSRLSRLLTAEATKPTAPD